MKTQATPENINKYYESLKKLHFLLSNTDRISMFDFSTKHNLTKSLSTVLQRGGVIKCNKKGKYSQWEWVTIPPTREMAIKTLQELAKINPERKPKRGGKREGSGRKTTQEEIAKHTDIKVVDRYVLTFFFGLITINIKPIYK